MHRSEVTMAYKLISFNLCPFVQRSVITLEEKKAAYEINYIDLNDKPDWFLKISPFGKVPVLDVEGKNIFESAVINEFIDETTPPSLLPKDPLEKAYQRAWIEFSSGLVVDQYLLTVAQTEDEAFAKAASISDKLKRFEEQIRTGPLFGGDSFSLVDAATAPALQRIEWCQQIVPDLDCFKDVPKCEVWKDALLAREAVKKSTIPEIHDVFKEYLRGRGSPTRSVDPSWIGKQI